MRITDNKLIREFGFRRCPACGCEYRQPVLECTNDVPDPEAKGEKKSHRCPYLARVPYMRYRHLLSTVQQVVGGRLAHDITESVANSLRDNPLMGGKRLVALLGTAAEAAAYRQGMLEARDWVKETRSKVDFVAEGSHVYAVPARV